MERQLKGFSRGEAMIRANQWKTTLSSVAAGGLRNEGRGPRRPSQAPDARAPRRARAVRGSAFATAFAAALLLAAGSPRAQYAPIGGHHAPGGNASGFAADAVSPNGGYAAALPLDLPPARGNLPLPVSV